jgi:hypothetical protein
MEKQPHVSELPQENRLAKLIAVILVAAIVAGGTAFVVYYSGLWQPQAQHTQQ